jgi:hypothetical protein
LTRPDIEKFETSHRWPQVLPGGRDALITIHHASGRMDRDSLAVVRLDSGAITRLGITGSYARYVTSGHIVYGLNGALLAVPFDLATLKVTGSPVAVVKDVVMDWPYGSGGAAFAISSTGALAYGPDTAGWPANSLVWVNRDGQPEALAPERRPYEGVVALSPDGRKVAVTFADPTTATKHLWTYDLSERHWLQLTREGDSSHQCWSPDSKWIAFGSNRDGGFSVYVVPADGSGPAIQKTRSASWQFPTSWSPDGRYLAYQQQRIFGLWDTWVLPLDGSEPARQWGPERVDLTTATFRPVDGRWIAYQSIESGRPEGRYEVYIRPFPGPDPRIRVSGAEGGQSPIWSADGRTLYYLQGYSDQPARVMEVPVPAEPTFRVSPPHLAFALPWIVWGGAHASWGGPTRDGKRVALIQADDGAPPALKRLLVITNFAEILKAKVPVMW